MNDYSWDLGSDKKNDYIEHKATGHAHYSKNWNQAKQNAYNHEYYQKHKRDKWGVGVGGNSNHTSGTSKETYDALREFGNAMFDSMDEVLGTDERTYKEARADYTRAKKDEAINNLYAKKSAKLANEQRKRGLNEKADYDTWFTTEYYKSNAKHAKNVADMRKDWMDSNLRSSKISKRMAKAVKGLKTVWNNTLDEIQDADEKISKGHKAVLDFFTGRGRKSSKKKQRKKEF